MTKKEIKNRQHRHHGDGPSDHRVEDQVTELLDQPVDKPAKLVGAPATRLVLSKRAVGVGATLVLILVIAAVAVIIRNQPSKTPPGVPESARNNPDVLLAQHDGTIRDNARQALRNGGVSSAATIYKNAVNAESDASRKVQLYLDESGVLYDAGKYDDAIQVAKSTESISDDKFLVADWLSRIYEDQKQYRIAAEYYTIAGKFADSPTNKTGLTKSYYDKKAADLAALGGK